MNSLVESLVKPFLLEEKSQKIGIFGGSFKPPTKGHLQVILESLNSSPDLDKFYILIGSGIRDNITQKQSSQIWNIYKKYLPSKVELIEVGSPLSWIKDYLRDNPNYDVTVFIGSRKGNEEDIKDFNERSKFIKKYSSNLNVKNIITPGEISGTKARNALQIGKDEFSNYLPPNLPEKEKEEIYNILLPSIQEIYDPEKKVSNTIGGWLHENATYSSNIDYKKQIRDLTSYMLKKDMNINPLPKVVFKHGNRNNAKDFFGKTAYYNPHTMTIVLYTEGRHPKDIVRSFSHEMIHHIQNIEDRLGNISTTNTSEDDNLNKLEQEAYLDGNITFRNWTDEILNENLTQEVPQYFYHATYKPLLPSIKKTGLDTSEAKFAWEDSKPGIVYLANDPYVAESYAESSEMVDDDWLDEIIILKVASKDLDLSKLHDDRNVRGDEPSDTFEYHGVIPWNVLKLYKEDIDEIGKGFDKKLGKDPYGINQFSRELVSEGRYDKISNEISSNIFNMWKKSFIEGKPSSRYEAEYEDEFFTIAIDANISFIPNSGEFKVDGGADEEDPYIQVRFEIDPDFLPKMWSDVSMALKDVIRHEVEHLTQGGEYEVSGKGIEDDMFIRKMIDADLLPKSTYFKLEKEIDANLQGMYFRAKKEKRPFRDVIDDYLDLQPITSEEKEEILNLWRKRLPALNLPKF